jgi:hypothetical protein
MVLLIARVEFQGEPEMDFRQSFRVVSVAL